MPTPTRTVPGAPLGRVLVVEDDASLLDLFVRALEYGGYECDSATSGDQALWSVLRRRPELIVLDVGIPHPSGIEVCRHLRAQGWNGGVVVVSARATSEDRQVALRAGADTFLAKPFALSDLVAAIDALLPGNGAGDRVRMGTPHVAMHQVLPVLDRRQSRYMPAVI